MRRRVDFLYPSEQGWRSRDKSRSRDWVKNSDLGLKATGSRSRSRNCVSRLFFKFWKEHAILYPELLILAF